VGTHNQSLSRELKAYERLLPTLVNHEGKFALIAGAKLVGLFDTYADALAAGYTARGLKPFLVKQVSQVELVAYFTRDLGKACPTSAAA
jgi:hypothetical protein